jgi:hypothetical protein
MVTAVPTHRVGKAARQTYTLEQPNEIDDPLSPVHLAADDRM